MKNNKFKGAIAALLASVMLTSSFTGCAEDNVNDEAARKLFFGNEEVTETVDDTNDVTTPAAPAAEGDNNEADACNEALAEANQTIADLTADYDALVAELAAMRKQLDAANALANENALAAEDAEAKRVNAANQLKAKAQELADTKNQLVEAEADLRKAEQAVAEANNPFTFNEEGFPIEIDFEDAMELLRVEMKNGTYGYRVGEGYEIDVIDTVVLESIKPYEEQTFQFAHHAGSPFIFYGVDMTGNGRVYNVVNAGEPMYAYNDAWAQPKKGEGFKLLETTKVVKSADIALALGAAINVYEDASSEYGWNVCINCTGAEYVAPVKPQPQKPVVQEPQVIVQEVIKEVVKEVVKEVPVVQEVIKEVPVVQEVIKEVPVVQEVIKEVEVPVFVPVIVPGEEDDDDDNDNNPENNPSRPDEDEFAPDGPADMPPEDDENDNAPENNPSRPDEDEFAPDGPADMPTDDNTGDNAGNDDTQDNGPADMPTDDNTGDNAGNDDTQDNGPVDMPTDNNTGDNAGNDDTQDNGPADMPTDNNTGDNAGNDDTQDNGPVDMPDPENNNSRDDESEFASENEDEGNFADSDVEDEIVDEGPQDMVYEPENSDATDFESEFAD